MAYCESSQCSCCNPFPDGVLPRHGDDSAAGNGMLSTFVLPGMDCPVEEKMVRDALSPIAGIRGVVCDLTGHTVTVEHEPGLAGQIRSALQALHLDDACGSCQEITEHEDRETLTNFRVPEMDCSVEEDLIRNKLGKMPSVHSLAFNLIQRTVSVRHTPSALADITKALQSLNLGAEVMPEASDLTVSLFHLEDMDCPVEENLVRGRLGKMPSVHELSFNLIDRTVSVKHDPGALGDITKALESLNLGAKPVPGGTGLSTSLFHLEDMDCPVEENLVRGRLGKMSSVHGLAFNLIDRTVSVKHDPDALSDITKALESLNLGATLVSRTEAAPEKAPGSQKSRFPWKQLITGGILAALAEASSLILEWHVRPFGFDPLALSVNGFAIAKLVPFILSVAAVLCSGVQTFKNGWIAIRNLTLNMNALMSVAVTGAICIGDFPEAAMVMVLFALSEAIEARATEHAKNAIQKLLATAPEMATVRQEDGSWKSVDIHNVPVGSTVRVRPGEKVPLDGTVTDGSSSVNQAPITGESMPVEKKAGDTVFAGTLNEQGSFEFTTTAIAGNTTLSRIIRAVEEAQSSRAPVERFVDVFAKYYTPAVFLLALVTAVLPPLVLGTAWLDSIHTGLILLVIGCPCALVISTPLTLVSGMAAATRHGILVKGGKFLEIGRKLNWIAFDKTGTLTNGRPEQTDFVPFGSMNPLKARELAASLAGRSDHPVSRAISRAAEKDGLTLRHVDDFTALPGRGTSGVIEGEKWYLGNHALVESLGRCSAELEKILFALEKDGKTVVVLVGDDGPAGLFAVADTIRATSAEAISSLKKLGVRTIMLTGDNKHTAAVLASRAGVDSYEADLLPEDKLKCIENIREEGLTVGMVGDGINDSPALAKADIGFAMAKGGTDSAIETADVALMDDDLRKVPSFIRLSRSTITIVIENISFALAVKAVFFVLAFTGYATMWMAVFADVGTSLIVSGNAVRALRK